MKPVKLLLAGAAFLLTSAFVTFQVIKWKVKADYTIRSGGITFKGLIATISFDEAHPEKSRIAATIDATTLNTGNPEMTAHAKEEKALHTGKYPVITFVSTAVKKIGPSRYEATGNLTLKGITKEVKLPFTFDRKPVMDRFPMVPGETFYGTITINPKDFNITRSGTPAEVIIELTVPVTK